MAQQRKQQALELAEIATNTVLLATHTDEQSRNILVLAIERDKAAAVNVLQELGRELSNKPRQNGIIKERYLINTLIVCSRGAVTGMKLLNYTVMVG